MTVNCRGSLSILITILGAILLVSHCSKEISGPVNQAPIIDSIVSDPDAIHPGADLIMTAFARDPEGDSLSYHWSTWPKAVRMSDSLAPVCTMTVNNVLVGGMKLMVALHAGDGNSISSDSIWITLTEGEIISGHVYSLNTRIPVPGTQVFFNRLIDTTNIRGEYSISHVPQGNRVINAIKSGCDAYSAELNVIGAREYDIYLNCDQFTRNLSGNISTIEGTNLENVKVTILNNDSTATDLYSLTDANGNYSIDGIPMGGRRLTIEDSGNPDYEVNSDTFAFQLDDDTVFDMHGKIRRYVYSSQGLESISDWQFVDDPPWSSWTIDFEDNCYSFNSCEINGLGRLTMASNVVIPEDAVSLSYTIEAFMDNIYLTLVYIFDDVLTNFGDDLSSYSGDVIIDRPISFTDIDPAGHNFRVEIWAWGKEGSCSEICLKYFSISYYR